MGQKIFLTKLLGHLSHRELESFMAQNPGATVECNDGTVEVVLAQIDENKYNELRVNALLEQLHALLKETTRLNEIIIEQNEKIIRLENAK